MSETATSGPRLAPRHLAVAFGLFYAWSEVTQAWRGWGLGGLIFTYSGFIPLQIASAVSLFRAGRRTALPEGSRDALRLLAWAFVALALGSAYLAVLAISSGDEARYTAADFFYLSSYPLQIIALLFLPRAKHSRQPRSRQLLDLAGLLLTSAILVFTHRMLRADWTGIAQFLATVYPILALGGLLAANTALTRGLPIPSTRAWRTLVLAMAISLITDVIFQTLWATGYQGPNWSLPFSVGVNLVILWAGHWYRTDPVTPESDLVLPAFALSPLPILLATGGAGVLLLVAVEGQVAAVQPVLITVILLNVLLATREFLLVMDATRIVRDETVRENERRFEALVRHSSDLVLTLDAEQIIRFASPALRILLKRSPEETVGRDLGSIINPEDRAEAFTAISQLIPRPGSSASMAVRFQHADGEWRRFECSVTNLLHEPAVRGIVLNSRDVTERTLLEEQLRQAQKMEVVGQLAGGVAHDFNNLLTTVLTGSEVALQGLPADHTLRADLESIRTAAQRGAALTSRLLSFSRPRGADPRIVRIGARVEGAIPLLQRLMGDSYTIRSLITSTNGAALVEPDELEHALLNLVANARDAMPSGGMVTIAVSERLLEQPLDTRYLPVPPGRYIVVEISDNGVGISDEAQKRLFQPFFTTKGAGTGLGLTGVFAFMRAANGGVTVQSTPGQGARLALWFPAIAPGEMTDPPIESNRVSRGSGTILLVEDDDSVRLATRRILTLGGYAVHEAATAEEARKLFALHHGSLDLLVTDVMMPGENGAELAGALREQKPGLRVLYISGYPGEDLARLGRLSGEVELLRKPFTVSELTERVSEVLRG